MAQRAEAHFLGWDQSPLYFQKWSHPHAEGSLIITHGQGEHSGCYHRLVQGVSELNLDVYAWDLRGHGKSSGHRGYAREFTDYSKDMDCLLKKLTLESNLMKGPIYLLAHSMGGLVQSKFLVENSQLPIKAQILSAPMFGVSLQIPQFKEKGAQLLETLFPKLTLWNEIKNQDLTRDKEIIREYEHDVLRHDRISAGVFLGSLRTISDVMAKATRIQIPTLLQISDHDPITSTPAAKEFIEKIGSANKRLIEYPGAKHEIYNDSDRARCFRDIVEFIRSL